MIALPDSGDSTALSPSLSAGWYGKMPCLGDFASRRLPAEFINVWDAWLQRSMVASRQRLGEGWLDLFLTSPMWRFALAPGVCGDQAWAGLLLPSVDKVGRYFPLTLALPLEQLDEDMTRIFAAQAWYAALEKIGLSALNVEFSPDELELALADTPFPLKDSALGQTAVRNMIEWLDGNSAAPQAFCFSSVDALIATIDAAARMLYAARSSGKSFWWSVSQDSGATETHCCVGLPPHDYFTVLLGGSRVPEEATTNALQAFGIEQSANDSEPLR
jgi:type VI secretion system protein ImpM